ncbi:hypothetical protein ACUNV4_30050 [Granulosicoccus sp. 3-233]
MMLSIFELTIKRSMDIMLADGDFELAAVSLVVFKKVSSALEVI